VPDTPQDIQLSRFVRPIGVTGLGTVQPGRTARRIRTTRDPFDGVLATGVNAEPGAPPADLSYLTLAPLVAQALSRPDESGAAGTTAGGGSISSDASEESESTGPAGAELRVHELLGTDGVESGEERGLRPSDLTVSDASGRTIDEDGDTDGRAGRLSNRTDSSDGRHSLSGWDDADGGPSGDSHADRSEWSGGETVSDPTRTVVEQSAHGVDTPGAHHHPSRPADRQDSSPPATFNPGEGPERQGGEGPDDGVPTTVVHRGAPRSDESGGGPGGQTGPATDGDAGGRAPVNGHGGQSLTVTGPGMTAVSGATDADSVSQSAGTKQESRPAGFHGEDSGEEGVTERTVIRSDGRLNDRVFDRLYEEVSRKMRLEREREGR